MNKIFLTLYHSSDRVITPKEIIFPGPRASCDFGRGFYLAESKPSAEEWVTKKITPVVNSYAFQAFEKDILYLSGKDWVRAVVGCRTGRYKVKFKSPIICGIIADDRMDETLPAFLRGEIGDLRLLECLNFCKLGNQYLLRRSGEYLSDHQSYDLRSLALQQAHDRWLERRKNMSAALQMIRRQPVTGEKYIEDYIKEGDFVEP